jgi:hypothetical protein
MATKRQGFWKNYSKKIVEMTSSKHKNDPMDAFLCLNKALLDLYKIMDNKGGQKEVNRYSGYVLHFVVLLDTIAMKDGDFSYPYCCRFPQWNRTNPFGLRRESTTGEIQIATSGRAWTTLPAGRPATCWSWP